MMVMPDCRANKIIVTLLNVLSTLKCILILILRHSLKILTR